jgi:hypothetical protein
MHVEEEADCEDSSEEPKAYNKNNKKESKSFMGMGMGKGKGLFELP